MVVAGHAGPLRLLENREREGSFFFFPAHEAGCGKKPMPDVVRTSRPASSMAAPFGTRPPTRSVDRGEFLRPTAHFMNLRFQRP
jgi:hypothetical protein